MLYNLEVAVWASNFTLTQRLWADNAMTHHAESLVHTVSASSKSLILELSDNLETQKKEHVKKK